MVMKNSIPDKIVGWYRSNRRDLPWRKTRNPYAIWVAEVMLQQTRVGTVIPHYKRFMERFPNIESLAAASAQDVLKAWEHMGYYARVRNLHAAAREIMTSGNGNFPDTWDEIIRLPGIGSYTAAAVLCFAFDRRLPAVDGNVRRVLSRLFLIRDPINRPKTQRHIYDVAEALVGQRAQ